MNTVLASRPDRVLQDAEFKQRLQQLRRTDNVTNWYYLFRTYLYLALVIGGAVWSYEVRAAAGLSWWWDVPVTLLAVVLVGAGQHQLTGLAHEGTHHTLFRGRRLNDLASDWLCLYPLFGTTHHYRLQHLAHHQFVNDPERDPDVSQLQASGHWLRFPLPRRRVLVTLLKQLWPPRLVRYMRVRARYNAIPTDKSPYLPKGWKPSRVLVRVGALYMVSLIGLLTGLVYRGDPVLLAVLPVVWWAGMIVTFALAPARLYSRSRVHPVFSMRQMTFMRLTYVTLLFTALAWVTRQTGRPAALYFFLLWVVPLFTSFAFFMVLRQLVQHGNGDRGWLTNTRVFLVHRLINFAVFPVGQDYHLPHHLYASVPHYRLRRLHDLLMQYPEYRAQATVVEGYFLPPHRPPTHPTVLDILAQERRPAADAAAYIDHSVLDGEEVEERAEILHEAGDERAA